MVDYSYPVVRPSLVLLSLLVCGNVRSFAPSRYPTTHHHPIRSSQICTMSKTTGDSNQHSSIRRDPSTYRDPLSDDEESWKRVVASFMLGLSLAVGSFASSTTTTMASAYDGFAEYAKDNQMEKSDVGCFINKCGDQTKDLFKNPRGIKGVSCLGRCKGEQSCAMQCFAEYGSDSLDNWLSCAIEDNGCVKMPTAIDNSAEEIGFPYSVPKFDPKSLVGSWYKTNGLDPNYDLFPCQSNTFTPVSDTELDMGIFLRIERPEETGGGYWDNELSERMVVDTPTGEAGSRTMHTSGKMRGLTFSENWYILGESDGSSSDNIPPFKVVAYKGHTLQGNYEGAFVYAKEPILPAAAIPAVKAAALRGGLDFDNFQPIDNTCPVGDSLNDKEAGTGTSTSDWLNLVVGEGGVIDWISPGWRGEYRQK